LIGATGTLPEVRSRLLLVIAFALFASACTPSSSTTTSAAPSPTTTISVEPEPTTTSTTETTLPPGTEELPEGLREEISRLIPVTEELRGLQFSADPNVVVLTTEELSERVIADVEENYEDPEVDEALYKLLGLVPADFDLISTILSLYGSTVAGFYDGETKELVVTASRDEFSPYEEATLVHELTHALTDDVLKFNGPFEQLFDQERYDEAVAFQALIEGDASLVELLYVQQLDAEAQQEFLEEAFGADTTVFDQVPPFMQASLIFPYDQGFTFVENLHSDSGFASVDAAYAAPPESSEQILWPDDYEVDLPIELEAPDGELAGYEVNETSTWGELGFRLMFDQVLGGADLAAEGWGGDTYRLYASGSNVVFALLYRGDGESDGAELAGALNEYVVAGMGLSDPVVEGNATTYSGDRFAFVSSVGDQVVFVAASDPNVGPEVKGWFPGF